MKCRFVSIKLSRLCICFLSQHFMLWIKILCLCKKTFYWPFGFKTIFAHTYLSKHQFANIILLWQTTPKLCGNMCSNTYGAGETSPPTAHTLERNILWQLPGRPPRSVKVKSLTPHKKVKEWVQKIPVYHTRNYQNRQLPGWIHELSMPDFHSQGWWASRRKEEEECLAIPQWSKIQAPYKKGGTKLHNTGSKPTTHHESFMEWSSREETIIIVLCHPTVLIEKPPPFVMCHGPTLVWKHFKLRTVEEKKWCH